MSSKLADTGQGRCRRGEDGGGRRSQDGGGRRSQDGGGRRGKDGGGRSGEDGGVVGREPCFYIVSPKVLMIIVRIVSKKMAIPVYALKMQLHISYFLN